MQENSNPSQISGSSIMYYDFFPQYIRDEEKVTHILGSSIKYYDFFPEYSRDQENVTHLSGSSVKYHDFFPEYSRDQDKVTQSEVPKEETSKVVLHENNGSGHCSNSSSGKRNFNQEGSSITYEYTNNKKFTSYLEDLEHLETFDKMLLWADMNPHWQDETVTKSASLEVKKRASCGGRACGKKRAANKTNVVDLGSLLLMCSQNISNNDISPTIELLKKIRQHSNPYGDYTERLAHYFVNAIEARLAGTGISLYRTFTTTKISVAQILKHYEAFSKACPFDKMTNIFANKSIGKLMNGRKTLHIIDFGILYGIQWPCMIQGLSLLPGERTKLRITGIDLPQPGFHPAERVEETGRCLAKYCKRFNLPFEYNAIAKKWENIRIEDLKIERDEMLVVNSIYRLRIVPDKTETVVHSMTRDAVLKLIKKMNPDIFVLGVLSEAYSAPFFVTRFREALLHFSALFDMFEATTPREDKDRFLFEQEVLGRDVMNAISCECTSTVERSDTYKKWQARNVNFGFRQLPLNQDIVQEVKANVQMNYHKDFDVAEDSNWMVQGWKGRVLYALSLWKSRANKKSSQPNSA